MINVRIQLQIFITKVIYFYKCHQRLNLNNPKTFTEKISYLKIYKYSRDPVVRCCADKYRAREYIKNHGLEGHLSKIYGVYRSVDDIPWDLLPNDFILKWNFWYGLNVICHDKDKCNINKIKGKMNCCKKAFKYYLTGEFQYFTDEKLILCEKLIPNIVDYKLYFFNGICRAVLVCKGIKDDKRLGTLYKADDWSVLTMKKNYRYAGPYLLDRPDFVDEMIQIGSKLSGEFPFVRIDMYCDDGRVVIGEMTFTPAAGLTPTEASIDGKSMGELLII